TLLLRHASARQRQRRASLRRYPAGRAESRPAGLPVDILTRRNMSSAPDSSRSPAAFAGPAPTWFTILMWAGIAANVVTAAIAIAHTEAVLAFLHLEMAQPLVWPRFAAFLLILLSIFYIPSAIDPIVHRYSAIVSIICRAGGVGFFTIVGGRYIV